MTRPVSTTMRFCIMLATTCVLASGFSVTLAAVPATMNVQGRLTDTTGNPVPAGEKAFLFNIFDSEFGGNRLWPEAPGETQFATTDANGRWTATVGAIFPIPDSVFADSVRWLDVSVSDLVNPVVTLPRIRLMTGAYTFMASHVMTVDGAAGGTITGKVTIGPGHTNSGADAFVAGSGNTASGAKSTVTGGSANTATGDYATVSGGDQNTAGGERSAIPGGHRNEAAGNYSFAVGRRAKALHPGTFVWGDTTDQDITSTGPNQFLIRANGGVGIGTTSPIGLLHVASGLKTTGLFTSTFRDPETSTLRAEYLGIMADAKAVVGKSVPADYWGVGGEFIGGFIGAQGIVNPTGSDSYYGMRGIVIGGSGNAYGCTGTASGGGVNYAVYGQASGGTDNWGGYFIGDVNVTGTLVGGASASKIDHPLDPENKYLNLSSVESPEMMSVYNGNVVLDADGTAVVALPDYFEALNRDFRYQLTCIGGFAPVYVAEKIAGNQFAIAGGTPGLEVSWQVTGIRQDAFANANRIPVEEVKSVSERGQYKYPAAYGQPLANGIDQRKSQEALKK